jgi:glycerophosphoryl diester phosphodiesterase
VLRGFAVVDPDLPRSYTLPRDLAGVSRAVLPRRLPSLLRRAQAGAVTLHSTLASERAIGCAHALGAAVCVWTVNDVATARAFIAAGADGIITDDPRIFSSLTT